MDRETDRQAETEADRQTETESTNAVSIYTPWFGHPWCTFEFIASHTKHNIDNPIYARYMVKHKHIN
jgi:hypothetical protein